MTPQEGISVPLPVKIAQTLPEGASPGQEARAETPEDPQIAEIRDLTAKLLKAEKPSAPGTIWNDPVQLGRNVMKTLGLRNGDYYQLITQRKITETDEFKTLSPDAQQIILNALDAIHGIKKAKDDGSAEKKSA